MIDIQLSLTLVLTKKITTSWIVVDDDIHGRRSADRTKHGNDVIFSFFTTVFGNLEVLNVKNRNIFLKYISATCVD